MNYPNTTYSIAKGFGGWYLQKEVQRIAKKSGRLVTELFHASDVSSDYEEIESLYMEAIGKGE